MTKLNKIDEEKRLKHEKTRFLNKSFDNLRAYCALKDHDRPQVIDVERLLDYVQDQNEEICDLTRELRVATKQFLPFHEMSEAQRDMIRAVWSQGMKFGRGRSWPRWMIFILGLSAGSIITTLALKFCGVLP